MVKKIEDYLHLYLGATITTHPNFRPNGKESIGKPGYAKLTGDLLADIENKTFPFQTKLILRPLSSITEEELAEISEELPDIISSLPNRGYHSHAYDELTRRYLSKHFDLFGLIEAGLAIDATTIKP